MWLQLSPVLPKDILRAKHPCRGPHSQTPHEILYKSTVKRNGFVTVWLGTDAFLLQDSFRKTPLQCNQLTCSTSLSTGHHSQRAHTPGRDRRTVWQCFWGCFQQWNISIASLLRQKKHWSKGFHKQAPHHPTYLCLWQAPWMHLCNL